MRLLEQATPAFIPPDLWPPNSSNLNPVDYKIWGVVQEQVYQSQVHSIYELKQRLLHVWHGTNQRIIDSAVDEWRLRLRACVRTKSGHYEHLCLCAYLASMLRVTPLEFRWDLWHHETRIPGQCCFHDSIFSHFGTILDCKRQRDRWTDRNMTTAYTTLA